MKIIYIILISLFCFNAKADMFNFTCKTENDTKFERCENDEVICYIYRNYHTHGISCKFKK